ncbi:MAG: efflux RND transporter periplasmic adaptor subunit [Peptococcaceae bacterium]|nr:efflux RND transporter periplasmic adaptor subunit [Peptococcaceae bacterium]
MENTPQLPSQERKSRLTFLKNKKKAALIAAVSLLIITIVGLNIYRNCTDTGVPVRVAKAAVQELGKTVFATGTLEPTRKQDFYAVITARIAALSVKPGDRVTAGQVLGCIENEALLSELKATEAQLAQQQINYQKVFSPSEEEIAAAKAALKEAELRNNEAQENLKRMQFLFEQGAIAAAELETARTAAAQAEAAYTRALTEYHDTVNPSPQQHRAARAQLEQAQAAYELANRNYKRSIFTAQIDGVVLSVDARQGDLVQTGDLIMTVGQMSPLEVHSEVNEADANLLAAGQKVEVTVPALPEEVFTGEITSVAPAAKTRRGQEGEETTVEVVIRVDNPEEKLRPGYTTDLNIIAVEPKEVLVVPYEAVIDRNGEKFVFAVKDGKAVLRKIATGISNELYISVTGGLSEGEQVIISPPDKLEDGKTVKVLQQPTGAEAQND